MVALGVHHKPAWVMALGAVAVVMASGQTTHAQCGAGGNFSGPCVRLEWRPATQSAVVGQTVELGLYAVSINGFDQPMQELDAVFDWDPAMLEVLGNKTCIGGVDDGKLCTNGLECDSLFCAGACTAGATAATPFFCPADAAAGTPDSYNWTQSAFPNDSLNARTNADCGPDSFCATYSGLPFNDGDAFYQSLKQLFCGGVPCPSAPATPAGLLVTTVRFKALAGGTTQIALPAQSDCKSIQMYCGNGDRTASTCNSDADCPELRLCSPLTGDPDIECTLDSQCPSGSCPPKCTACSESFCCTLDSSCSICSFEDTRVLGGTTAGNDVTGPIGPPAVVQISDCIPPTVTAAAARYISVTPAPGTNPVAFRVTSSEIGMECVNTYSVPGGFLPKSPLPGGAPVVPTYQTPATWGTFLIRGADLVANRLITIQADCNPTNPGTNLSSPVTATTWAWADVDDSGGVDIIDITKALDAFRSLFNAFPVPCTTNQDCVAIGPLRTCNVAAGQCIQCLSDADCVNAPPHRRCDAQAQLCVRVQRENADFVGSGGCTPDGGPVDILDVTAAVDAFRGLGDPCTQVCVP